MILKLEKMCSNIYFLWVIDLGLSEEKNKNNVNDIQHALCESFCIDLSSYSQSDNLTWVISFIQKQLKIIKYSKISQNTQNCLS